MKIKLLPLDERPCNLKFVQKMGLVNPLIELITPPLSILGKKKTPANLEQVNQFIMHNNDEIDHLILSLDMFLYGGLLPSRLHNQNFENLTSKLNDLVALKKQFPKLKIWAFSTIMRTPKYNSSDEEPDYYEKYGANIFRFKYLSDKANNHELNDDEKNELNSIKIPEQFLSDYELRRKINLQVNLKIIELLEANVFEYLIFPQDDSAPFGYTRIDQQAVFNQLSTVDSNKYSVHPGADEVAMTLLARIINTSMLTNNLTIYYHFRCDTAKNHIPNYEDRELIKTVDLHLNAAGFKLTNCQEDADAILYYNTIINNEPMLESFDQNLNDFKHIDLSFIKQANKPLFIVDKKYSNGGDLNFVTNLINQNLFSKLHGYAAWNTNANSLGTVLCQIALSSNANLLSKEAFVYERIFEDLFYQAIIRKQTTNSFLPSLNLNYFDLSTKASQVITYEAKLFDSLASKYFPNTKFVINHSHPWNRMFEIDLDLQFKRTIKANDFIVSCQALEDEPLHSSFIMSKLALAAYQGGANGIRANTVKDISYIRKEVDLPIIGIIKKDYADSNVYITPTMAEIDQLVCAKVDIIALDATIQERPNNCSLKDLFMQIKQKYPNLLLMADCSTFDEMEMADQLGFDFIGTTLFGYTPYSQTSAFNDLNTFILKTKNIQAKIIAEGQINTPEQAKQIKNLANVYAIVVGGAITRPQNITKTFINHLK